ncbi:PREDICTED: uncharacterized protein LOC109473302 [Branchiostoma belcheri]|uniref:Uncharacterized protein LOC109473302 n=1 Tax=Branchiostoma belcheri TaxID=7741 RepID=A0A6P4Z475_BRABE|nr:PREDICTED: uncharacterized protein LOC109473302 [Branchiostoma belcheri]
MEVDATSTSLEGGDAGTLSIDLNTQPNVTTKDVNVDSEDQLTLEIDKLDEFEFLEEIEEAKSTQATAEKTASMPGREARPAEIYSTYLRMQQYLKNKTWHRRFGHYAKLTPDFTDWAIPPTIVLREENDFDIDLYPEHSSWSPPSIEMMRFIKYPTDVTISVYEQLIVNDPDTLRRLPALSGQRLGVCDLKTTVGHLLIALFRLLVTNEMVRNYTFTARDLQDIYVNNRFKSRGERPSVPFSVGRPNDRTRKNLHRMATLSFHKEDNDNCAPKKQETVQGRISGQLKTKVLEQRQTKNVYHHPTQFPRGKGR